MQSILKNNLNTEDSKFVERIEKIYVYLEHVRTSDARLLSDSSKANLRRAQSELQRIRLLIYDLVAGKPLAASA